MATSRTKPTKVQKNQNPPSLAGSKSQMVGITGFEPGLLVAQHIEASFAKLLEVLHSIHCPSITSIKEPKRLEKCSQVFKLVAHSSVYKLYLIVS